MKSKANKSYVITYDLFALTTIHTKNTFIKLHNAVVA